MSLRSLDAMLENDTEGELRDGVIAQFGQMQTLCAIDLREPASVEEYQQLSYLHDACIAAQRVVKIVWQRHHAALASAAVERL